MEKTIALIRGDYASREIIVQAVRVLDRIAERYGHTFRTVDVAMGGDAIDRFGDPLPDGELAKCLAADAVLLGAVGGPKWDDVPADKRPERGLLRLRKGMELFANLRPSRIWPGLESASPLSPAITEKGIDIVIVRELTGGAYFGAHKTWEENGETVASDLMIYSEHEIERIGRIAFETAKKRTGRLCSVDKANVLDSSKLWRKVMHRLANEYPEIAYEDMYVDNCAMQLVRNPARFDVIVTENMFGDILSDELSIICGSIGMAASSSLGATSRGLYEPIHGSAPDIAGQDKINPCAAIMSVAMMLEYSFGLKDEAKAVEKAVRGVLADGIRTVDIFAGGNTPVGCRAMGDAVLARL